MSTGTSAQTFTVNCPACGAVNPEAGVNSVCAKCGEALGAAVLQHNVDEIRKITERMREMNAPAFRTFNGFGTTLLDYRRREDGEWEATRWVVAAMLPVAPLGSYVIRPRRQQNSYGRVESFFDVLGRAPLSPLRILRVYGLVALGLAPIVVGSLNSSWVNRTLGGPLAALAMVASVVWGAYIIFFRIKNDSKAYKQPKEKPEAA